MTSTAALVTSAQLRMARAGLGWTVRTVATRAEVPRIAVMHIERGGTGEPRAIRAIVEAFEAAGVEFTNGDAPGVKLRKG